MDEDKATSLPYSFNDVLINLMQHFAWLDDFDLNRHHFNLMYDIVKANSDVISSLNCSKSDKHARILNNRGREAYRNNLLEQAWKDFTDSTAICATPGDEMAAGYGERSLISLFWQRKDDYIADNIKAASLSKSEILTGLYKERICEILRVDDIFNKLTEEAAFYLTNNTDDETEYQEFCNNLNSTYETFLEIANMKKRNVQEKHHDRNAYHDPIPTIMVSMRNPKILCASKAIEIRNDSEFGSHIVATENIRVGDILMIEKALVATPLVDDQQHCHECLEMSLSPIPCDTCHKSFYCSAECKKNAQSYHKYECIVRKMLYRAPKILQVNFLAIKLAIMMRDEFKNKDTFPSECYRSDRFCDIFKLQEHSKNVDKYEKILWLTKGVYVYYILKHYTDFFNIPRKTEAEEAFKDLIIKTQSIVRSNSLPITEVNYKHKYNTYSQDICGYGLFTLNSYFNHSCFPNVGQYHYGSTVVSRAIQTIRKGSQCFVSYWSHHSKLTFDSIPWDYRQENLKEYYYFSCKCRACMEEWQECDLVLPCVVQPSIHPAVDKIIRTCDIGNIRSCLSECMQKLQNDRFYSSTEFRMISKAVDFCFCGHGNRNLISRIIRDYNMVCH